MGSSGDWPAKNRQVNYRNQEGSRGIPRFLMFGLVNWNCFVSTTSLGRLCLLANQSAVKKLQHLKPISALCNNTMMKSPEMKPVRLSRLETSHNLQDRQLLRIPFGQSCSGNLPRQIKLKGESIRTKIEFDRIA